MFYHVPAPKPYTFHIGQVYDGEEFFFEIDAGALASTCYLSREDLECLADLISSALSASWVGGIPDAG